MSQTETTADHTAERHSPRLAANPIAYRARDGTVDNSKAVLDQAFADLADIGFTAVKADVPEGMTADEYRRLDQQLRAGPIAQPVQLALRRDC